MPLDRQTPARRRRLVELLVAGVGEVLPGMRVEVECRVRASLHGDDAIDLGP